MVTGEHEVRLRLQVYNNLAVAIYGFEREGDIVATGIIRKASSYGPATIAGLKVITSFEEGFVPPTAEANASANGHGGCYGEVYLRAEETYGIVDTCAEADVYLRTRHGMLPRGGTVDHGLPFTG
jgi:hypothetical protein